ncbi:alginate lyase [Kitasatospora sp. MMS16-BH015]|uniref:DUF1272 domain-containing protein n=1 Tax=Kitasatospora sp. MMS16-BH015 TaxID=2018025 RepID=UPI000CA25486|nr:DUF1272 domain-containing protein [Kitasatospora sp. MMS16-BH015]AUG80343.1 alginate lyase [Kitasatospora sp. MMS16-BH015]
MALEMREICERCEVSLTPDAPAYICSYECTFCPACTEALAHVCPNCGGEQTPRPRRVTS